MTLIAEKELAHLGETAGCADHDHDLVHELSRRLDSLWRIDQYMVNAESHATIRDFWQKLKKQEQANVEALKNMVGEEVRKGCF